MRKKLDLTGQRFGRLIALAPAANIGSRTAWACRCDCGRETVALTVRLRDGHCRSCGCDRVPVAPTPGARGRASLTYVDGTCVEMLAAKTVRRNNSSGVPGVDWRAGKQTWRAAICFKGKRYCLGSYHSFEEAVDARKQAEERLHDNFLREFAETQTQGAKG